MRQQTTLTLSDDSLFKAFAITLKDNHLRINIKHLKNGTTILSQSFESNIASLSEKSVNDRIKEVIVSSLKTSTTSLVQNITGNIDLDKLALIHF